MKNVLAYINGKKTYIVMIGTVGIAIAMLMGYEIPNAVWILDAALAGGALRSAIRKLEPPKAEEVVARPVDEAQ